MATQSEKSEPICEPLWVRHPLSLTSALGKVMCYKMKNNNPSKFEHEKHGVNLLVLEWRLFAGAKTLSLTEEPGGTWLKTASKAARWGWVILRRWWIILSQTAWRVSVRFMIHGPQIMKLIKPTYINHGERSISICSFEWLNSIRRNFILWIKHP